jgi:ubiquitin carboxyl-terminal hydrolase 34
VELKKATNLYSYGFGTNYDEDDVRRDAPELLVLYIKLVNRLILHDYTNLQRSYLHALPRPQLSQNHLATLRTLLVGNNFIEKCLVGIYEMSDVLRRGLASTFLLNTDAGIKGLAKYFYLSVDRFDENPAFVEIAIHSLHIVNTAVTLGHHSFTIDQNLAPHCAEHARYMMNMFHAIDARLNEGINKQNDPINAEVRKNLPPLMAEFIRRFMQMDESISKQIFDEIVGNFDSLRPDSYPSVASWIWKIKHMWRYIRNGRMELRVIGADTMSTDLVTFYTEHGNGEIRCRPIPMEFKCVAQLLLDEGMVEYMVGVSSHPQVMSRSGNIIGFLVITDNFTTEKADMVWEKLSKSEDPRITAALLFALNTVFRNLTELDEEVYLCKQLVQSPIPFLVAEAYSCLATVFGKLRSRAMHLTFENEQLASIVIACLQLMIQCAETHPPTQITKNIREEANNLLSVIARDLPDGLRQQIYKDWVARIEKRDSSEVIYMQAILTVVQYNPDKDLKYLANELQLTRIAMESFESFVQTWKSVISSGKGDKQREGEELGYRLSLILKLLETCPESASSEVYMTFWDYLVGRNALNNMTREYAWKELAKLADDPRQSRREALDSLYEVLLPTIRPENFTPSFIACAEKLARLKIRDVKPTDEGAEGVLRLPGVDLMWRVMLMAPEGSGEDIAIKFLANIWMSKTIERFTNESIETNHRTVVRLCIKRMNQAYNFMYSQNSENGITSPGGSESMDTTDPEKCNYEERAFSRCAAFLRTLMMYIRSRPEMIRPLPQIPVPDVNESGVINGEPLTIKYQVYPAEGGQLGAMKEMVVGDLETRQELHQRVCQLAGFSKFKLIWGGMVLNLLEKPMETLRDFKAENRNLMMIKQDAPNPMEDHHASSHAALAKTVFDREVLNEFETLYKFMDSEDGASNAVYELLKGYPPHESICQRVADQNIDEAEVFPENHIYKILYSLRCLDALVQDERKKKEADQQFLLYGVHSLERLLIKRPLPGSEENSTLPKYLNMFSFSVSILITLLKELDSFDSSPFDDGAAVVERIVKVLKHYLRSPASAQITHETFELLLYTVIACPKAWAAFKELHENQDEIKDLHKGLLLASPNPNLRGNVNAILKTSISRFRGNTHLQLQDFIQFYWKVIAELIEVSSSNSSFASDLFTLAEYLFKRRFHDNGTIPSEDDIPDLESYWDLWSTILLNYQKDEFVGREVTDPVIAGLSNLLYLDFEYLKEIDRAPDTAELAEKIWRNLLFPDTPHEDWGAIIDFQVPLLDGKTRSIVYKLLAAITIDNGVEHLLKAAEWVTAASFDKSEEPLRWIVDRSRLIRPESGYLGLRNLGNTCYMNSLLTQLYMNPVFRSFIINQPMMDHNRQILLAETQVLFSRMQNGYAPFGDPQYVARNIRTYFDEPINVHEQMDVEEFFNLLFEQWETQLDSTEAKESFRAFYGGKLVNQIKSKECDHVSENEERYLNVQCDVYGKTTLSESLQAFIEGDVMQGDNQYKCEKCGGRMVDAVRRARLKEIPDNLILHLKRFNYDLTLQRRNKINDYFEFPLSIDMNPYTLDYDENEPEQQQPDMFELVGVLVHKGQAEHGHYISYIRERPSFEGAPPVWLLFDDSEVTVFDQNELGDACFGGFHPPKDGAYGPTQTPVKAYNAYMLFYQRSSTMNRTVESQGLANGQMPNAALVPYDVAQLINFENALQLRNYCLFGQPHGQFVKTLAASLTNIEPEETSPHTTEKAIIGACLQHMWRVSSRAKDSPDFHDILKILLETVTKCHLCGFLVISWFAKHITELRDLMVRSTSPKVRQQTQAFVVQTVRQLRDTSVYGLDVDRLNLPTDTDELQGALPMTLNIMMTILQRELHYNGKGFDEFFGVLYNIADFGEMEALLMILRGFFTSCLELLVMHRSTSLRAKYRQVLQLIEKRQVAFNKLTELLALLFRYVDLSEFTVPSHDRHRYFEQDKRLRITDDELYALKMREEDSLVWLVRIFDKWVVEREDKNFAPADILTIMGCEEDRMGLYQATLSTIKYGIEDTATVESELYIRAVHGLLTVCPYPQPIRTIIKSVNRVLHDNDGHSAAILFNFYDSLRRITNRNFPPPLQGVGSFYKEAVLYAYQYGPVLLTNTEDAMIRYQTVSLLEDLLTRHPPVADQNARPTEMEHFRTENVRKLFKNCAARNQQYLEQDFAKQYLQPIMTVMKSCAEFVRRLYEVEAAEELRDDASDMGILDQYGGKSLPSSFDIFVED